MPPPRNASTYNARPPTREREELAKRCLERSKNALLEFQKKSAALGVAVAPMTAPDGTTVAYEHFDGVRVAPPVENAVIKLVENDSPSMPAPKPRLPLSPKNTTTTSSSWKTGFLETKKTDARGRFVAPPPAPPRSTVTWKAPPPKSPLKDVAALPTPTLIGALEADLGARLGTTPPPAEPEPAAVPAFSPMPVAAPPAAPVAEPEPEPASEPPVAPVVEPEPEPEPEPPAVPVPEAAPPSDAAATKPGAEEEEEDLKAFLRRGRRLIAGSASAAAEREALREQAAAAAAERAALSARLAAVEASAAEPVAAPAPAAASPRTAAELLAEAMATIANDDTLASDVKVVRAATRAAKVLTGAPETPPPPAPQPAPAKPAKTPWVPPPARSRSRSPPRPRSPRPRTVPAPPLPVPSSSPPVPRGRVADDTWRRTAAAWRKRLAAIEATHARLRGGPFPEMRERPFAA